MHAELLDNTIVVRLTVTVHVDVDEPSFREWLAEFSHRQPDDVLVSEVRSHLESLDYVRHVTVRHQSDKEDPS